MVRAPGFLPAMMLIVGVMGGLMLMVKLCSKSGNPTMALPKITKKKKKKSDASASKDKAASIPATPGSSSEWLVPLGLGQYAAKFDEEGYEDTETVRDMSLDELTTELEMKKVPLSPPSRPPSLPPSHPPPLPPDR